MLARRTRAIGASAVPTPTNVAVTDAKIIARQSMAIGRND